MKMSHIGILVGEMAISRGVLYEGDRSRNRHG
jgi:hypothetical protein